MPSAMPSTVPCPVRCEAQGHAQVPASPLNPFLRELQLLLNDDTAKHDLAEAMKKSIASHVATYILTDKGNMVVQESAVKVSKKAKARVPRFQAFGGCNYPNNIVRMINSLRLELMDESS